MSAKEATFKRENEGKKQKTNEGRWERRGIEQVERMRRKKSDYVKKIVEQNGFISVNSFYKNALFRVW
jgi:hypothetical protein